MRKTLLRGLLGLALSLNIALVPTLAQADVASAFQSLLNNGATVSKSAPGQFSSQARNTFVGGGIDVRFPQVSTPQILSVTPFRVQAGCGGVSLFFGGFSFISGAQIVALIKAVAQNAVGLAVELVMTTLCGPCASVMQIMRKLALDAASGALNSCQIAKSLMASAESAMGYKPEAQSTTQNVCTELGNAWGYLTDSSQGQSNICNDISTAMSTATSYLNKAMTAIGVNPNSPRGSQLLCGKGLTCNVIWTMLNQTDLYDNTNTDNIRDKLLLMNITGTTMITQGVVSPTAANPNGNTLSPPLVTNFNAGSATSSTNSTTSGSGANNTSALSDNYFTGVNAAKVAAANAPAPAPQGCGSGSDPLTCAVPSVNSSPPTVTNNTTYPGVVTGQEAGQSALAPTLGITTDAEGNGIKNVFKLLECGVTGVSPNPTITDPAASQLIAQECVAPTNANGTTFSLGRLQVMDCADSSVAGFDPTAASAQSAYSACLAIYKVPLGTTLLGANEGYLYYVANLLFGGVSSVQNNTALDPDLIALIQEVPVPIYQAINVAAVYPDAGYQLISSMSVQVAQMLIYEHIRDLIQVAGRFHNDLMMKQADLDRVLKLFGEIDAATQKDKAKIATEMTRQQVLMQQIREINVAIQNEVMTPELLGAHRYGQALTNTGAK